MTLVWRPGFAYDTDASNYIDAVEAADQADTPGIGAMETGVRYAINDFVLGCKQDGIWTAIKASCILAGARTRTGALVPLVGAAPISFNFVDANYNRKTGLVGDGSTKYLNSNRNNNADPQDSCHQSCYITNAGSASDAFIIGAGVTDTGSTSLAKLVGGTLTVRNRSSSSGGSFGSATNTGFYGASRSASATQVVRTNLSNLSQTLSSQTPFNGNVFVFGSNTGSALSLPTNSRLAFYSIGESLNLALLDNRVSTLIAQFGAVIP